MQPSLHPEPKKKHPEPKKKLRTLYRRLLTGGLLYLAFSILAGMVIADLSLKLPLRPLRHRQEFAALVQKNFQAELQDAPFASAITNILHECAISSTTGAPAI